MIILRDHLRRIKKNQPSCGWRGLLCVA